MARRVIAAALMAMVVAGTVPGATLDVTSVDASAYTTDVIDFVVPEPYAAVDLTPAMVDVDGAPAEALAPVYAASVVVRLLVDDTAVPGADRTVSDEAGESPFGAIAVALEISMAVVVAVWLVLRWRRRWRDRRADPVTSQRQLDRGAAASTAEPQPAPDSRGIEASQPPARNLPTMAMTQPLSAFRLTASRESTSGPDVGDEARSQTDPALADKGTAHDVAAQPGVPDVAEAGAGVGLDGPTPKRPPRRKPALATTDDSASEAAAAGELESAPVTPKPKPTRKRTPKPKPAVEHAAAAEPGAAEEAVPVPKPKPKRTPRPRVPQGAESASAVDTDVTKEAVPTPKPKPKPKRDPKPRSQSNAERPPVPEPEPEPLPEAEATREPIVDQTPVRELEPEPITGPTPDRRPRRQAAARATPEPVDRTHRRPVRAVPPSRSVRRRGERPSPTPRTRRAGRRAPEPADTAEGSSTASEWLVAGSLRFSPASGEVWAGSHQIHLTPSELAILELLMTGGDRGVTEADIIGAGGLEPDGGDIADTLSRIRRKTGLTGRGQTVRRERVTLYFLDDEVETGADNRVSHRPGRPSARR